MHHACELGHIRFSLVVHFETENSKAPGYLQRVSYNIHTVVKNVFLKTLYARNDHEQECCSYLISTAMFHNLVCIRSAAIFTLLKQDQNITKNNTAAIYGSPSLL